MHGVLFGLPKVPTTGDALAKMLNQTAVGKGLNVQLGNECDGLLILQPLCCMQVTSQAGLAWALFIFLACSSLSDPISFRIPWAIRGNFTLLQERKICKEELPLRFCALSSNQQKRAQEANRALPKRSLAGILMARFPLFLSWLDNVLLISSSICIHVSCRDCRMHPSQFIFNRENRKKQPWKN